MILLSYSAIPIFISINTAGVNGSPTFGNKDSVVSMCLEILAYCFRITDGCTGIASGLSLKDKFHPNSTELIPYSVIDL